MDQGRIGRVIPAERDGKPATRDLLERRERFTVRPSDTDTPIADQSLLDDARTLVRNLTTVSTGCRLEAAAGRSHTWPVTEPEHPDSTAAVASFGRFISEVAERQTSATAV